jgi:hypothetical protein
MFFRNAICSLFNGIANRTIARNAVIKTAARTKQIGTEKNKY